MAKWYGAFLRGINVNGNKIPMKALQEVFQNIGYPDAKTILNTGNVVFSADEKLDRQKLKVSIERELNQVFGYNAPVYLRTEEEITQRRESAAELSVPEGCHLYLLLCENAGLPDELAALFAEMPHLQDEQFVPLETEAFWVVPKGSTLISAFGSKVLGAKKYQNRLTSRNMNTIMKMAELMK